MKPYLSLTKSHKQHEPNQPCIQMFVWSALRRVRIWGTSPLMPVVMTRPFFPSIGRVSVPASPVIVFRRPWSSPVPRVAWRTRAFVATSSLIPLSSVPIILRVPAMSVLPIVQIPLIVPLITLISLLVALLPVVPFIRVPIRMASFPVLYWGLFVISVSVLPVMRASFSFLVLPIIRALSSEVSWTLTVETAFTLPVLSPEYQHKYTLIFLPKMSVWSSCFIASVALSGLSNSRKAKE